MFRLCLLKTAFLTKNCHYFGIKKDLFYHLDITLYTQRTILHDEMFLKISVRENVYPLSRPTWFCAMANFRCACVRTHVLLK